VLEIVLPSLGSSQKSHSRIDAWKSEIVCQVLVFVLVMPELPSMPQSLSMVLAVEQGVI
jgi:hypothetical protein